MMGLDSSYMVLTFFTLDKDSCIFAQVELVMKWLASWTTVKTLDDYPELRPHGVPLSFKGPLQFQEVHVIHLIDDEILVCS
jgi:hypothetical protein